MHNGRRSVLFVNSGFLGHRSVARLLEDAVRSDGSLESMHLDLGGPMTVRERLVRKALCLHPLASGEAFGSNLDFARWRQELHVGLLAAKRIREAERAGRRFDVLHFHTQAAAYASIGRMRSTPSIVSIDCTQGLAREGVLSRLERASYWPSIRHDGAVFRAARAIIATSEWAASDLAREYPDCAGKVRVLPYPVRFECFDEVWIDERRRRHGDDLDWRVRLLFIGGDFPRKGGAELLEAWRQGDFSRRAALDLVTNWPVPDSQVPEGVHLIRDVEPFTPRWSALWREADAFVMPTRAEAFGMVYQEAAAAGLPVIATRLSAIPEIVEDGVTGILIPARDVQALVAAMQTLVSNADLRHSMGAAARRRIASISSPARYSRELIATIDRVGLANRV